MMLNIEGLPLCVRCHFAFRVIRVGMSFFTLQSSDDQTKAPSAAVALHAFELQIFGPPRSSFLINPAMPPDLSAQIWA